jgi:hypothetical protein
MKATILLPTASLFASLALGCNSTPTAPGSINGDMAIAENIVQALVEACPMASPSDEDARNLCAANLSDNKYLPSVMKNPFPVGRPEGRYELSPRRVEHELVQHVRVAAHVPQSHDVPG